MGKPSRVKKLELKAKRAATNEVTAAPVPNENTRRAVKDIFRDAKNNRSHGSGSSGGFIPSAKHVEGGMMVKRYDGSGRSSYGHEGSERMDTSRAPLMRGSYRAPSLTVVKAPPRPTVGLDTGRTGTGPVALENDTRKDRSAFAEGVARDRRSIQATGAIRRPADPDGRALWETGKRLATEPENMV